MTQARCHFRARALKAKGELDYTVLSDQEYQKSEKNRPVSAPWTAFYTQALPCSTRHTRGHLLARARPCACPCSCASRRDDHVTRSDVLHTPSSAPCRRFWIRSRLAQPATAIDRPHPPSPLTLVLVVLIALVNTPAHWRWHTQAGCYMFDKHADGMYTRPVEFSLNLNSIFKGTPCELFNFAPVGVNSTFFGSPHVCPMGVWGCTCGEPGEIKNGTHPKIITALFREQAGSTARSASAPAKPLRQPPRQPPKPPPKPPPRQRPLLPRPRPPRPPRAASFRSQVGHACKRPQILSRGYSLMLLWLLSPRRPLSSMQRVTWGGARSQTRPHSLK